MKFDKLYFIFNIKIYSLQRRHSSPRQQTDLVSSTDVSRLSLSLGTLLSDGLIIIFFRHLTNNLCGPLSYPSQPSCWRKYNTNNNCHHKIQSTINFFPGILNKNKQSDHAQHLPMCPAPCISVVLRIPSKWTFL